MYRSKTYPGHCVYPCQQALAEPDDAGGATTRICVYRRDRERERRLWEIGREKERDTERKREKEKEREKERKKKKERERKRENIYNEIHSSCYNDDVVKCNDYFVVVSFCLLISLYIYVSLCIFLHASLVHQLKHALTSVPGQTRAAVSQWGVPDNES